MKRSIGIAILLALVPASAYAADPPLWVRLALPQDASSAMTITWNTKGAVAGEVQYGLSTSYGSVLAAPAAVNTSVGYKHSVTLTGLKQSRTYHYRVGNATDGYSPDYMFVTAPSGLCAPFSFVAVGDGRGLLSGVSGDWSNVLAKSAENFPSFLLYGGDFIYDGSNATQWTQFLDASKDQMPLYPLMCTLGNHDDGPGQGATANYNQIFEFPKNSSSNTIDFYSFDFGGVHVVAVSTETFNASNYQMQAAWLDADLAATNRIWKIVFLHRPVYSSGNHGSDDGHIVPYLTDIFDKYHVDAVIGGHDHDYERFKPMKAGKEVSTYTDGTLYMVTGGAGANGDPLFPARTKLSNSAKSDNTNHYVLFSVDGQKMHVKAVRVPGGIQGGDGVVDEFDMVKDIQPDPCLPPPSDGGTDAQASDGQVADSGSDSGQLADAQMDSGSKADGGLADVASSDVEMADASVDSGYNPDDGSVVTDSGADGGMDSSGGCSCSLLSL